MFNRLLPFVLAAALFSAPAMAQTKISASQTLGAPGVYQVTNTGVTITLPNWAAWPSPLPIIIKDGTGNASPIITVHAPLGGTIAGASSVSLSGALQGVIFYPFQGGNTWVGGGAYTAGRQGSVILSDIPVGSAVSQTTSGTAINVTSVSLTPGDWDCTGSVVTAPNTTTTTSQLAAGISTTSVTLPVALENGETIFQAPQAANIPEAIPTPRVEELLSATTTVYLVGDAAFATSTMSLYGQIMCRRMR